ncbi:caspase family protein [Runella sp. SP2]|uniref:caspase family protein n=1 Tax=Runella sp. SP2 TaxID=2268026 RepID=UPI000F08692B|nr:caspase family protein [Runella sp. SP2]AYQ36576.1 hypothetical protein DTQ70_30100 [Runella sp. SP2]
MKKLIYIAMLLIGVATWAQKPELRIPIGHYGQINDLQESPDGKLLASASADGTIKIWEKNTGILLKTLEGHSREVNSIDFSSDGKTIVSGSSDKTVVLWDVFLGQQVAVLGKHEGSVQFVAYSPDGKFILSMAVANLEAFQKYHHQDIRKFLKTIGNEPIKVWNTSTRKEEENLSNHQTTIKLLHFLPNNDESRKSEGFAQAGVVYGTKYCMKLLMIEKGILSQIIEDKKRDNKKGQNLENYKVIYVPTTSQFMSNSPEDGLEKWEAITNKFSGKIKVDSLITGTKYDSNIKFGAFMDGTITNFQYFTNDKFTVLTSAQKILIIDRFRKETNVFEINTSEKKSYASGNIEGMESILFQFIQSSISYAGVISQLEISKDGQFLLGFSTGTIMLSSKNGLKRKEYEGDGQRNVSAVAWGENDQSILTGHWDNFSKKFNFTNGQFQILHKHSATVSGVKSTSDFDFATSADIPNYNDNNRKETNIWGIDNVLWKRNEATPSVFRINENSIVVCCNSQISNKGKYIATYGKLDEFGGIYLFNIEGKRLARKLDYPKIVDVDNPELMMFLGMRIFSGRFSLFDISPTGNSLVFSNDDSLVAALTNANTQIGVWNVNTGNLLKDINPKEKGLKAIAFSPDGRFLAYGGINEKVTLMDLSNERKNNFKDHTGTIFRLQYSIDGRYLASGSEDQTIVIRDGNTGTYIRTLKGHTGSVNGLDFSKDGKYLLSGSNDHTAKIWSVQTGKELASLISVDSTDWVITSPEGFFDASPGAMKKMYYVQGLETFDLVQLKERYWVPGLMQELLGYTQNGLPPSIKDTRIPLPPAVKLSLKGDVLTIKATKRDGGLGKIVLFIDNIEVETDLRTQKSTNPASGEFVRTLSLKNYQRFLGNGTNLLRVVAYEQSNQISTRGDTISYVLTGAAKNPIEPMVSSGGVTPKAEVKVKKASFYGVTIGANTLGLRYASKDAEVMKQIIEKVAHSFIDTTQGKVKMVLFSQAQPTAFQPTKENIIRYLTELKKVIKPEDYLYFFFSGHGKVFTNKAGENDFAMLLQGIRQESTDLSKTTLSEFVEKNYVLATRNELTKLLNDLPARKKIIVMDACGSESAAQLQADALVMKQNRPNREKALDNMSSRTGIYFLASSATNQASFEHPLYEHGFLTYSLLRGIKSGAATKYFGAEAYLEISTWFNYAEVNTPKVAAAVGQVQQPKFLTPKQAQNDIYLGIVDEATRSSVNLLEGNKLKIGSCSFQDEDLGDILELSDKLNAKLRDESEQSADFWYENTITEGTFSLRGRYKRAVNGMIPVEINLYKGKTLLRKLGVIEIKDDNLLVNQLKEKLMQEAKKKD